MNLVRIDLEFKQTGSNLPNLNRSHSESEEKLSSTDSEEITEETLKRSTL